MSYVEQKKKRQEESVNVGRFDFGWEVEHLPTLHSGFLEPCAGDESKSTLFLSLWFSNGSYRFRLQDRSSDEKAFGECGTLAEAFSTIEEKLNAGTLDWSPDKRGRSNGYGS